MAKETMKKPTSRKSAAHHSSASGTPSTRRKGGKKRSTKKKKKRGMIIAVEVLLILVVLIGFYVVSKLDQLQHPDMGEGDTSVNESIEEDTVATMSGYTTVALFGLDTRESGQLGKGNRSDTIIIASINNDTGEVRLASVFRDTYLDMDTTDGSFAKANAAYSKGGPTQAISMLNKNLDLDITDYVSVDFNAVADCVDLLGGITMDITDEEAAIMNGETEHQDYIGEVAQVTGKEAHYLDGGGTYNLDGVQATAYARIRYTAGDDYRRALRQRTVITKLIEKAKKADVATLTKIVDKMTEEVSTSYSNKELLGMAVYLQSYELADTCGFPFYKNTANVGKQGDCVIPCDLTTNVEELHTFLFEDENYTPSNTVEAISDKITTKTGYSADDAVKTSDPTEEDHTKTDDVESTETE